MFCQFCTLVRLPSAIYFKNDCIFYLLYCSYPDFSSLKENIVIASLSSLLNFNLWFYSSAINSVLFMFIDMISRIILMLFHLNVLIQFVQFSFRYSSDQAENCFILNANFIVKVLYVKTTLLSQF